MTSDEAFGILKLPPDTPFEQVKRKYHQLALRHHPDKGGAAEDLQRINEAYGHLRSIAESDQTLAKVTMTALSSQLLRAEANRDADKIIATACQVARSRYSVFRNAMGVATGLCGVLALSGDKFFKSMGAEASGSSLAFTIVLAFYTFYFNHRMQSVDSNIQRATGSLEDPIDLIAEMRPCIELAVTSGNRFTRRELSKAITDLESESARRRMKDLSSAGRGLDLLMTDDGSVRPLSYLVRWMGIDDTAKLILAKAKAAGLVSEVSGLPFTYCWSETAISFAKRKEDL